MPNGGFLRENCSTFLKLMKMPCAVSGRRYAADAGLLDRADRRLEHQVEVARAGQVALLGLAGMLGWFAPARELCEVVGAEALPARAAVHERVGEAGEVAGGLPHARVLQDRRVDRHDVVALLQHRAPPLALDVVLQQHAVVAVVVGRADPAVDLRGGEHEAAPLAQRDDLLHRHRVARRLVRAWAPTAAWGCSLIVDADGIARLGSCSSAFAPCSALWLWRLRRLSRAAWVDKTFAYRPLTDARN